MDPKWTDGNELEYLKQVLQNSPEIRKNPYVDRLEKAFIHKYKVNYAIALNSGASCLHSALVACGVRPGDEVITSPFSVLWDSEIVLIMWAKIVFADIKYGTHKERLTTQKQTPQQNPNNKGIKQNDNIQQ